MSPSFFLCGTLLLGSLVQLSAGKFIPDLATLNGKNYDYVVVGAGIGGSVVASRLSEDKKARVLLIEAGGSNEGVMPASIPLLCITGSPNTPWSWNYTTTPQPGFGNRSVPFQAGHILGGGSSINFMFYTRGSKDDWDRYAKVTHDQGWSWQSVQPFIRKLEGFIPPANGSLGQFDPQVHAYNGPLKVGLPPTPTDLDSRVLQTTKDLKEFPFTTDMNDGNPIGLSWAQTTISNGSHFSVANGYLTPSVVARPNLDILLNTRVTRLLKQKGSASSQPRFSAVEIAATSQGPRYVVNANREIVLSSGAVGTPRILLHSGIGNKDTLKSLQITPTLHLPDVGQNLADHIFLPNIFVVNSNNTPVDSLEQNPSFAQSLVQQWTTTRTGRATNTLSNFIGWFRLKKTDPIFKTVQDPSAGPTSPHIEMLFTDGFLGFGQPPPSSGNHLTVVTTIPSPASRGHLTLRSNNPFDDPIVDPGFLTSPFDHHTLAESVRTVRRFVAGPAWKDYVIKPFGIGENITAQSSDAEIDPLIKSLAATGLHAVSTAMMSPKGSTKGVVDPDLKLKGATGVRVVDGSVFPFVPAAHLQAPVYILAERAASLIQSTHY